MKKGRTFFPEAISLIAIRDEMAMLSRKNYSEGPICGRYDRHRDLFCGSPGTSELTPLFHTSLTGFPTNAAA